MKTPYNPLNEAANKIRLLAKDNPFADMGENLRASAQGLLGKLDLVTREEYDIQAALLARTREKLAALETRLAALEARVTQNDDA